MKFTMYEQPQPEPVEVLDRNKVLEFVDQTYLHPGEARVVRAGIDVPVFEADDRPALYVIARARQSKRFYWTYGRDDLRPLSIVSADMSDQRLEFALRLAETIGDDSLAPHLESVFGHPAHNIRWAAIRTMIAIDPCRAHDLLRRAVADPHPHVSAAAKANLPAFEEALARYAATVA